MQQKTLQNGRASVWSGATGALIRTWDGDLRDALFGHWVMPVPDLDGDGLADLVIAAPNAFVDGVLRGVLVARSPATGEEIWRRTGTGVENFGWDLALAGDQDGDGRTDLFVGAPSAASGRVCLVGGHDGAVLRSYAPRIAVGSFGWYVARLGDQDGDGRADVVVGAPLAKNAAGRPAGGAWVFASTGRQLRHWRGPGELSGFGEIVADAGDLDGDGTDDVAVAAPRTTDQTHSRPGEVHVYSGATGKTLRHWSGRQPGELFGRMVFAAGDVDGDGVGDVAIGAPWYRRGADRLVGRMEIRSGRTGKALSELFGDGPDDWFGWHIRRAPDPEGRDRPTLLVSSLRHPVGGEIAVGLLDLLVFRRDAPAADQGTITRGARRSDIR